MLIDANVFKGFFQTQISKPHSLCGCPAALLAQVTSSTPVYHDGGGIIEHEWRSVVDPEWFDAWLATSLLANEVQYLEPTHDNAVEKAIKHHGFPGGRDIVYVRMGLSVVAIKHFCTIYTEDMDFYDPSLKAASSKTRISVLKKSAGPVAKVLLKKGIAVKCVP